MTIETICSLRGTHSVHCLRPVEVQGDFGVLIQGNRFLAGGVAEADTAVAAAKMAFPNWRSTPWQERVRILRKAADLMEEHTFEIGVVLALEAGKNRMEALGDIAESVDLGIAATAWKPAMVLSSIWGAIL